MASIRVDHRDCHPRLRTFRDGPPNLDPDRPVAYLAVTGGLGVTVGQPRTLIWVLPTIGAVFHLTWRVRHGINPLTAEPRDRCKQLRRRRPAEARR
jgi:hypothetical protein